MLRVRDSACITKLVVMRHGSFDVKPADLGSISSLQVGNAGLTLPRQTQTPDVIQLIHMCARLLLPLSQVCNGRCWAASFLSPCCDLPICPGPYFLAVLFQLRRSACALPVVFAAAAAADKLDVLTLFLAP